jgi:hypothetical protein
VLTRCISHYAQYLDTPSADRYCFHGNSLCNEYRSILSNWFTQRKGRLCTQDLLPAHRRYERCNGPTLRNFTEPCDVADDLLQRLIDNLGSKDSNSTYLTYLLQGDIETDDPMSLLDVQEKRVPMFLDIIKSHVVDLNRLVRDSSVLLAPSLRTSYQKILQRQRAFSAVFLQSVVRCFIYESRYRKIVQGMRCCIFIRNRWNFTNSCRYHSYSKHLAQASKKKRGCDPSSTQEKSGPDHRSKEDPGPLQRYW